MYPRGRKAKLAAEKARIYKATGRTLIVLYILLNAQSLQLYSALLGPRLILVEFIWATLTKGVLAAAVLLLFFKSHQTL